MTTNVRILKQYRTKW